MLTKTVSAIFIVLACILLFPIVVAIIGGTFGVVFGVIGGLFGAIFGVIGGIFGAIFGIIESIFDGLFYWDGPFGFWNCSPATVFLIAIVLALLLRRSNNSHQKKTP